MESINYTHNAPPSTWSDLARDLTSVLYPVLINKLQIQDVDDILKDFDISCQMSWQCIHYSNHADYDLNLDENCMPYSYLTWFAYPSIFLPKKLQKKSLGSAILSDMIEQVKNKITLKGIVDNRSHELKHNTNLDIINKFLQNWYNLIDSIQQTFTYKQMKKHWYSNISYLYVDKKWDQVDWIVIIFTPDHS